MTRRNFTKATQVARFKLCGGLCECILDAGSRCNAVLIPGRWHCDHHNPDGLTGEPTLENARCLCLECHAIKTKVDVANIAKAKRVEAKHIGVEMPKAKIAAPAKPEKPPRDRLDIPPRRHLYEKI